MSPGTPQIIITSALLLHGIAHAISLIALTGQAAAGQTKLRVTARSWLFYKAQPRTAAIFLLPFWIFATFAFIGSAASSWGVLIAREVWPTLAFVGALGSVAGVLLVAGIWPGSPSRSRAILNSLVAMVMNLAILSARYWFQWLPSKWIIG
jgi:hypothetical protein